MYKIVPNKSKNVTFDNAMIYTSPKIATGIMDKKKKTFTEVTYGWCRDILIYDYTDYFIRKRSKGPVDSELLDFPSNPFNRTQLLMIAPSKMEKSVLNGDALKHTLMLLNKLEKSLKWRRTKAYECKTKPSWGAKSRIWAIEGSKCWVNNPYLMYIYLAVFKVMFGWHAPGKYNTKTVQELFVYAHMKLRNEYTQYEYMPEWLDIIKDRAKLFRGFTTETLYSNKETIENQEAALYSLGVHCIFKSCTRLKNVISSGNVKLFDRVQKWHKTRKR